MGEQEASTAALTIVQTVLLLLVGAGGTGGVLAAWSAHQSRKAQVSSDERQAKLDRSAQLEAENRALRTDNYGLRKGIRQRDDYIYVLRKGWADGSPPPPAPWPEDWTHF